LAHLLARIDVEEGPLEDPTSGDGVLSRCSWAMSEHGASAALERRRLTVRGRVQGVAFRASTREAARRVGASGWVRNLPDGGVEAVVEGTGDQVAAVLAFCRTGPSFARVDDMTETPEPPEGLRGFEIR